MIPVKSLPLWQRFLLMWCISIVVTGAAMVFVLLLACASAALVTWDAWWFGAVTDLNVWRAWFGLTLFLGTLQVFHREIYPKWWNNEE